MSVLSERGAGNSDLLGISLHSRNSVVVHVELPVSQKFSYSSLMLQKITAVLYGK